MTSKKKFMPCLFAAFALSLAMQAGASRLFAQSTFGSIVGSVRDASGAAVTAAAITVREIDTNIARSARSDGEGLYEILNLKPGRYEITAAKGGFATARVAEARLEARQTIRADLMLEVSPVEQTILVTGAVPLINTENGTLSESMNSEQIMRLPTNYRALTTSPLYPVVTVPGVQSDGSGDPGTPGRLSIGGGLPSQIESSLDGISTLDLRFHTLNPSMGPSAEMISEFRVTTAGNSAAFGQMGDITLITKVGKNQLHGSAFWYHQNAALDAATYGSPQKQHKVFNTFGGSISGPVYIPGIYDGHNRAFFFLDYEGNRKPMSQLDEGSVPTLAMRQGDLNGLPGGNAVDPLTGLPFPGNLIPASRISGVVRKMLDKYYPAPNLNVPLEDLNYRVLVPADQYTDGYDMRLDQVLSSKQQIFVRWSQKWQGYLDDIFPLTGYTVSLPTKNLVVSHTYTPNPNLSNEFRFGLSLYWPVGRSPVPGKDVVADLGLQGLDLHNVGNSGGFPLFDFSDGTGFQQIGVGKDYIQESRTFQSSDTLSWISGRHTMKFGAEARQIGQRKPITSYPYDDFGGFVFSSGAFSGNAFADLLLGLPAQSYYSALGPDVNEFSTGYAFFAQDNWKVIRRFTLELGLRWELHPPLHEQSGNLTNFDHSTGDVIVPDHTIPAAPGFLAAINACSVASTPGPCTKVLSASQAGLPDTLRRTYYRDWGPRFGFAWRPWSSDKTVLRGGIGIYTMPLFDSNAGVGVHSSDNRTYINYQGPGMPPLFTFPNVYPGPSALGIIGVESASGVDPTLKDPRSYQWNLTVEHELPWATSFRASYIGTQSVGLPATVNFNQVQASQPGASRPFPLWGGLGSIENLAFSNYQGLQTVLSHRLKSGFFFQASYVFSKNIGNADTPRGFFPFEGTVGITDRFDTRYNRGNVAAARQHRFLLTGLFPLPFGRGRAYGSGWRGFQEALLGGWETSTVSLAQSGPFQTPKFGGFFRPDRIGNGNLPNPTRDRYYDKSAFVPVPPGAGRLGNAGVGILEGPGTVAIAAGLSKKFRVAEKLGLRVESTFTNLPNHPNFLPPNVSVNSPQFGKLTTVQRGENAGNRTGQVAVRLEF